MESNFVHVDIVDNLAIIELDDPSANTLTFHLLQEVEQQFIRIENNPHVHGVVLIGKGEKFFSGGVNIGMLLTAGRQHNSHFILYAAEVLDYIESSELPLVTLINGNITGGGLELALIADYRIAIEGNYNIGFPEVRLGVIPGMGGTQRLSRLVGPQRALEMITQGEFINPEKSQAIGLVDEVLPATNFRQVAIQRAAEFVKRTVSSSRSVRETVERHMQLLQDQTICLNVDGGLAVISLGAGCDDFNTKDVLLAINELLIEIRTDDAVYALLIDNKSQGLGRQSHQLDDVGLMRLATYIFNRISGYARISALHIHRSLSPLELELALHCDYRLCDTAIADSAQVQSLNYDSKQFPRYRNFFKDCSSESLSINDLVSLGFFLSQEKPDDWLRRFIPPTGAGQAIGYAKLAITQGFREPISAALLLERHLQEQLFMSHDSKEGMKAYVEKRKPFFTGA